MPFETTKHAMWVTRFTLGKVPLSGDSLAAMGDDERLEFQLAVENSKQELIDQAQKDMLIQRARATVAGQRDRIQSAFVFEIEAEGKVISTLGKGGDQTKTVDSDEAGQRMDKAISGAQQKALGEAHEFLKSVVKGLEDERTLEYVIDAGEVVPGPRDKPLFRKADIRDEIYTPLVREQILPEQMVEKQFSDVQQMLDASNEYYLEELKNYSESESIVPESLSTAVDAAKEFAKSIEDLVLSDAAAKAAQAVTDLVAAVITTSIDGYTATRAQSFAGLQKTVGGIAGIAGDLIGGEMGKAVKLGIESAMNAAAMVVHLTKEDGPDIDAFLADCVSAVGEGFGAAVLGQDDKDRKGQIKLAGDLVTATLQKALAAKKAKIRDEIRAGNWNAVGKLTSGALIKAISFGLKGHAAGESAEAESDEEQGEISDRVAEAADALKEATDSMSEGFELAAMAQEELRASKERLAKEAEAAENSAVEDQLAADRDSYKSALEGLGSTDPNDNQLKSISSLIAKIEKDRAIMKMAVGLSTTAATVLTEFFNPMALAGTLLGFVANLQAAVERANALRVWSQSHGEAITAVSPYASTVGNFIKNQKEQFAHYTIKAVLKVVKAGAQIAGNAVVIAHVAKAVEAVVTLGETAEELAYKVYNKGQLSKAWKMTEQALKNPNNRRLGLLARGLNPTLAKYTIAYGAVVKRDAIAISAMNRIGLDRETLAMKSSKVAEVKRYLDTLYQDDQTVLGEFDDGKWPEGKPPAPALNVKTWLTTVRVMMDNLKVSVSPHDDVIRALKKVAKLAPAFDAAERDASHEEVALATYTSALRELVAALAVYEPVSERADHASPEMVAMADRYSALAEAREAAVWQASVLLDGGA